MAENVTQNKSGITINVSVSAKIQKKKIIIICTKKITVRILLYILVKMVNS